MKNWNILGKLKSQNSIPIESGSTLKPDELIDLLLENRGIKTKKEKEEFLNPDLSSITSENVGIDKKNLKKALARIEKAIKDQEQIVVFGDYDVDGITASAIIWEIIHAMGGKILPYIPNRIDEGYGLSTHGIDNIKHQTSNIKDVSLIITVDNGIVANEAVAHANKLGIDVIVTDHHVPDKDLPKAHSIVHTTKLCGAGVAYVLAKEISNQSKIQNTKYQILNTHLELAALGTIADMVPLVGASRTIVKFGLENLSQTKRLGLLELYKRAGLEKEMFTPYEVGFIIAPRLNASGRIDSAMDSLRLLCTKDRNRASDLADKLELTNKERQLILKESTIHAVDNVQNLKPGVRNLIFVAHETYQQGVIGLVAGKLVEQFYRPSIVVSIGETHSKASARSITGFNIIEFLRRHTDHFVNVGGHPMAAGFTFETAKLEDLQKLLEEAAEKLITEDLLVRSLKIDCEFKLPEITPDLYEKLQTLSPFGMGNPEPTFVSYSTEVKDFKLLGKEKNHLKLTLSQRHSGERSNSRIDSGQARMTDAIQAIGFGMGEFAENLKPGDKIDIVYTIDENVWNGNTNLQLKIKDIKLHE